MTIGLLLLFTIALTLLLYILFIHIPDQRRKARTKRYKAYLKRRERLLIDYEEFKQIALFAYRIRAIERIKNL